MDYDIGYLIMAFGLGYACFWLIVLVVYLIKEKISDYRYEKRIKNNPAKTPTIGITYYKNKEDLWNN